MIFLKFQYNLKILTNKDLKYHTNIYKDTMKEIILKGIKTNSCDNCGGNNIYYWKEDKEEVNFKCQKCGAFYQIPFKYRKKICYE
ncbi:hypothetical protein LCGC14_2593420 [marine sediment metagenome]|uniref:GATA-type domain-containing protein n=1 Tax=marine sediment metagenome TaxID=412755 RepID=A0A0F9ABA2_9ZZZZ